MKILFLDQTGKLGGAEIALLDVVKPYRKDALVGLFEDGPFRERLEQHNISVEVLVPKPLLVKKDSGFLQGLGSLGRLLPLASKVAELSKGYDLIYANTAKALVVGAIASVLSRRPLVYHLHDILSAEHFSQSNIRLLVFLSNRFVSQVIADSNATKAAFIAAGGRSDLVTSMYYGFEPEAYQNLVPDPADIKATLGLKEKFVIGHFSRLSPWKGQDVLIEALSHCPHEVEVLLVGDALFGEDDYVAKLHQQIAHLKLEERIHFLGFRSDVAQLMNACDLVAHTSTAPEPFGRVIVEGMLCGTPVVAAAAGGAAELVEHEKTGWSIPPNDVEALAKVIKTCHAQPELAAAIAQAGQQQAAQRFDMDTINAEIADLLTNALKTRT